MAPRAAQRQDGPGCSPAPLSLRRTMPYGDRRQPGRQQALSTSRTATTRSLLPGRTFACSWRLRPRGSWKKEEEELKRKRRELIVLLELTRERRTPAQHSRVQTLTEWAERRKRKKKRKMKLPRISSFDRSLCCLKSTGMLVGTAFWSAWFYSGFSLAARGIFCDFLFENRPRIRGRFPVA